MKLAIRVSGVEVLRRKFANVAECAVSGSLTRRGMSEAARLVTRAQKNLAPVRKGRIQLRKLDARLKKGMAVGKATRLSSVPVVRRRKATGEIIKPGLIRRSIGYRILKVDGSFMVKMGMNVGKKRSNSNFAPHSAFVGKAKTGQPRQTKAGANRGVMPANLFIANGTRFAARAAIAALDRAVKEDTVRAFNLSLRASRNVEGVYA